jgi:hypothetical protein
MRSLFADRVASIAVSRSKGGREREIPSRKKQKKKRERERKREEGRQQRKGSKTKPRLRDCALLRSLSARAQPPQSQRTFGSYFRDEDLVNQDDARVCAGPGRGSLEIPLPSFIFFPSCSLLFFASRFETLQRLFCPSTFGFFFGSCIEHGLALGPIKAEIRKGCTCGTEPDVSLSPMCSKRKKTIQTISLPLNRTPTMSSPPQRAAPRPPAPRPRRRPPPLARRRPILSSLT